MATLKEVQQRIVGVQKTQKITRAMKIVAATKLKKCERARKEAEQFSHKLEVILKNIIRYSYHPKHPLLEDKPGTDKMGFVLIASDRGLCGAFNSNLFRKTKEILGEKGLFDKSVFASLGRRAGDFLKKEKKKSVFSEVNVEKLDQREAVGNLTKVLVDTYRKGEVDQWVIISNRFLSRVNFGYTETPIIPLSFSFEGQREDSLFKFEDDLEAVLDFMIPRYIGDLINALIVESQNVEEFSRMMAMDYATENANELIGELTLHYNRTRQQVITTELTEIVGGAEALK